MKTIYVAHPLRGQQPIDINTVLLNKKAVDDLCERISKELPDNLILSPIHAFSFVSVFQPQEWVLSQCLKLLELADELWVFGSWTGSEGCQMEIERAKELGVPIYFKDYELNDLDNGGVMR